MKHRLLFPVVLVLILALLLPLPPSGAQLSAVPPVPGSTAAGWAPLDARSTTGPVPPPGVHVAGGLAASAGAVVIPGVPAYQWHHGCGPTAAGMVIGAWDGRGFDALVPGDASTQTVAVNAMIATEGPASNFSDYCLPLDVQPILLSDKSEPPAGDEHPDDCVADFMGTSQSYHKNYYGWSWFLAVRSALEDYVDSLGWPTYQVTAANLYMSSSLNWDTFRAEMDAGRPMVFLVDTDGNGGTDHFVTAIGYDVVDNVPMYACLNTWDAGIHWFQFAPLAAGQPWGIYGAVTFHIRAPIYVYLASVARHP
jgi:hypothetical protein